jgi:drug/metabolite transporter (DMT)-like permease
MSWLALAIITRFFWAGCNVIDQYVSRYFGEDGIFSVVIIDNMTAMISLPVLFVLAGHGLALAPAALLLTVAGAVLSMVAIFPYMRAMQIDDAHNVAPLFELTPVFVMILAWALLGETMSLRQSAGALMIIASGFSFTWDFNHNHLKKKTLALMAAASLMYAVCQLTMRHVTQSEDPYGVAFYFTAGTVATGIVLALRRRQCAAAVVAAIRQSRGKILALTALDEAFSRLAFIGLLWAYAKAPTAGHVAAFSGTQPVFVFMLALVLGHVRPLHYKKLVWDRDMKVKMLLLPVMLIGAALVRF